MKNEIQRRKANLYDCDLLPFVVCVLTFIDAEQAKLLLPIYERILSKQLRSVYTETRAHTIDDFMTGIETTISIRMPCLFSSRKI